MAVKKLKIKKNCCRNLRKSSKKDNGKRSNNITQLNAKHKFKVVMLIFDYRLIGKLKI
jgi:hypothetical protein